MAKINYNYYSGIDTYNDGQIEDELLEYYKNDKPIDTKRDDIIYLTTDIRKNILSWYPFNKNDSILEVGAGVGTLTSMLCENAGDVISVEDSKRRSEVLYERNKKYDNLEVMVGNFNKMEFSKKFDYIVLIGVFEYSKIFCKTDNPFEDFLKQLKQKLKPNGKILIAIENRYGIKYWAGNMEDHFAQKYVGLNGYSQRNVQTFGVEELKKIAISCEFEKYKFYYPFPDYKMPSVIYTDDRLPGYSEISNLPIFNFSKEEYNFDPKIVLKGILENNQFAFFSNSFVLELGGENSKLGNISYAKYQPYRNSNYQVVTMMNDKHQYFKKGLGKESQKNLDELVKIHEKIAKANINTCKITKKDNLYMMEFIDGKTVQELISYSIIKGNKEQILTEIDNYIKYVYSCSKIEKIDKNNFLDGIYNIDKINMLKLGLLDFNMGNVIKNENGYYLFDQEWLTKDKMPTDYVIYFSIKLLYESENELLHFVDEEELYKKYNINKKMQAKFNKISIDFFDNNKKFKDINMFKHLKNHGVIDIVEFSKNKRSDDDWGKIIKDIQNDYEKEIANILNSTSWKLTKPIRNIKKIIKKNNV